MKTIPSFMLVVASLFALGCGGSTPEIRYYRVASLEAPAAPSGELVIGVEPFATDSSYDAQKIVYRTSPYRLDYYHYHRWSAPPGIMVADYVRDSLENTGHYRAVESGFTGDAVAIVGGRIIQFEEVDVSDNEWRARVKIVISVRSARTGELAWSRTLVEEEPLESQSPEGLARAMSAALDRVVAKSAPEIHRLTQRYATSQ